jgi:hypothetical protein
MMQDRSRFAFGAICCILLGITYLLVGVFHTLSPIDHRISSGPAVFLPAIASGFSYSMLVTWSFTLGAIFALGAVPALGERFRRLSEGWILWARNLALLAFAVTATNEFTILAVWPERAAAYVAGDSATRATIALLPLLPLDPHGWLLYGGVGIFVFIVSLFALRAGAVPRILGAIGLGAGILLCLAVAGFVLDNETLISIAAGLGGVLLLPIWFIWMGLLMHRETASVKTSAT